MRASVSPDTLLSGVTTTGAGAAVNNQSGVKTYQAYGKTTAGAGSAVIAVQGSSDGASWDTIGTITLTLTNTANVSDAFSSDDRYPLIRGNVTTLTGTNAAVTLKAGS